VGSNDFEVEAGSKLMNWENSRKNFCTRPTGYRPWRL